ncbi:MAG: FecR domain-containing protein [Gemmatimonadetes bacterium]|nr:FecR domain-containing protein [Gemmatimonadota bacterium]
MPDIVEFPDQRRVEQEAAEWLIKLDRNVEPSADELGDLRKWLSRSPVHREELLSLARLWGNMNVLTELAVPLENIGAHERKTRRADRSGMGMRLALGGLAAMVIVGFSIFFVGPDPTDSLTGTNGVYATSVGEQRTMLLADGSLVVVNTNSAIQVNFTGQYRDIQLLRGEAHFTVAENNANPFRVFASNSRVEAIGTAFAVYLRGSEVQVIVSEGRVALVAHKQAVADPITSNNAPVEELLGTLEAGEVGIIADGAPDAGTKSSLRRIELANVDRLLAWRVGLLAFSGDSLETVVTEISRYTTVSIEIPDPAVRAIRAGGQFPVGEIDAMLAALEVNFGLRVQRLSPDHVVLSAAD